MQAKSETKVIKIIYKKFRENIKLSQQPQNNTKPLLNKLPITNYRLLIFNLRILKSLQSTKYLFEKNIFLF